MFAAPPPEEDEREDIDNDDKEEQDNDEDEEEIEDLAQIVFQHGDAVYSVCSYIDKKVRKRRECLESSKYRMSEIRRRKNRILLIRRHLVY